TGTALVKDINPGIANSDPWHLTVSGGHLFFSADDGVHGRELWDPPIGAPLVPPGGSVTGNIPRDPSVEPTQFNAAVATHRLARFPSRRAEDDVLIAPANSFAVNAAAPATREWPDEQIQPPPTDEVDQALARLAARWKAARRGWPAEFDWQSDLLADLVSSWKLR